MFYTYILQSLRDHRTYVGYCKDIKVRLEKHNSGQVKSTCKRTPLKVIYLEQHETMAKAKHRELYWKSGGGRRKLRAMFSNRLND